MRLARRTFRRARLPPLDLVDAAIDRTERLNPALNAVITNLYDKARALAVSGCLPNGPFRGVPLLLKDYFCYTDGDPYYEGTKFLRGPVVRLYSTSLRTPGSASRVSSSSRCQTRCSKSWDLLLGRTELRAWHLPPGTAGHLLVLSHTSVRGGRYAQPVAPDMT